MKRKLILIIFVFLFNIVWVNAISITNKLASHYNIVIKTTNQNNLNNNIVDDLDIMLENNLTYNGEDAALIGKKIDNYLKEELAGKGELIAKYSASYEIDPYLIASMIIETTNCDSVCSVLVKKCNNVSKALYNKDNMTEASCCGGYYQKFNSVDDSIKYFIMYVKLNYYDQDIKTVSGIENANDKDVRWVFIINQMIDKIKNSSVS